VNVQYLAVLHNNCYKLLLENMSLFYISTSVKTGHNLGLYILADAVAVSFLLSLFLHPVPCFVHSFLDVTEFHYNVFAEAVHYQTRNRILVG
jgi:hypothetical protein